jgi:hypothetical protein
MAEKTAKKKKEVEERRSRIREKKVSYCRRIDSALD